MKKVLLTLAFAGMVGALSAGTLCDGDKKCDKDKCKDKDKKECCKKGDSKEAKSCCKKSEAKSCHDKKAEEKK